MSLLQSIFKHAIFHPRKVAIIDDQRSYSYLGLACGAMFVARAIRKQTRAKHVGIMLPTSGGFAVSLLGCWQAGRTAVPINYLLAREELEYVLRDSDIDTLITVGPMLEFVGGEEVIPDSIKLIKLENVNFRSIPPLRWPPSFQDDDVAVILYTSGTSGRPKGVMLTHFNLAANVKGCVMHADINAKDTLLGVLPQFHCFGLTVLTLLPLSLGASVVYSAKFIPRRIVELLRKHRPNMLVAIPSMYGSLLSVKSAKAEDFSSLRLTVSGGEPLPDALFETFNKQFNLKLCEGYGLTETSPATHWSTPQNNRRHAVGLALADVGTFIFDERDNLLPADQEGEIILSGPNIMKGYYKLQDQTDAVMVDLPPETGAYGGRGFRTGDIGKIDSDGYLYITGRKKEMLIIGGENVFPREIEEVLNRHESVKASAVVGRKDPMRGEVAVAYVEIDEDHTFDDAAIRNFCREYLAQFKVPKEIRMLDALPRNPTGKIMRRALPTD